MNAIDHTGGDGGWGGNGLDGTKPGQDGTDGSDGPTDAAGAIADCVAPTELNPNYIVPSVFDPAVAPAVAAAVRAAVTPREQSAN